MPDIDQLLHTSPDVRFDPKAANLPEYQQVIRFAEALRKEAVSHQEEINLQAVVERGVDYMMSRQFDVKKGKEWRTRITANIFSSIVKRYIALLTDAVPQMKISSRSGNDVGAIVATDTLSAVWDEADGQEFLTDLASSAIVKGFAAAAAMWNPLADFGHGDISLEVLDDILVDPYLRRARDLQKSGMFVIVSRVLPLSSFRLLYGERGRLVRPDPVFSSYNKTGTVTRNYQWRRPSRRESNTEYSAIPRAREWRLYFRDETPHPDQPEDGQFRLLFPRKRLIVWSKDVLLYDGDARNWDGKFPIEMWDWGINLDHPYGTPESEMLYPLQAALNMLLSQIVHNARLINDPPWMVTNGAMAPEGIQRLQRFSDRPGTVHIQTGLGRVEKIEVSKMEPQLFQTIGIIQGLMEYVSGMLPSVQGQRQPGINSGVAIDALQTAAQAPVRLDARHAQSFLQRFGHLLLARIFQYFPDDRIIQLSDNPRRDEAIRQRQELLGHIALAETARDGERYIEDIMRDYRFKIDIESGLAISQAQRYIQAQQLHDKELISDEELLHAGRIPEPKKKLEEAREEAIKKAMVMSQLRSMMMPQQPQSSSLSTPQTPGQAGTAPRSPYEQQQIEQLRRD